MLSVLLALTLLLKFLLALTVISTDASHVHSILPSWSNAHFVNQDS